MMVSRDTGVRVADLNGDGLPDFMRSAEYVQWDANLTLTCDSYVNHVELAHAATTSDPQGQIYSPRADYLIEVDNPIGGKTNIYYKAAVGSYTPSTPDDPNGDYNPSVPYVVDHVTQSDGRGAAYTTSYDYHHPKWDVEERQFAGFREVTVLNADGTSTKTTYHQDFPLTGMVDHVDSYEAASPGVSGGPLYQTSSTTYEAIESSDGTGVWRVHKLSDRTTVTENGGSLTTGVDYGPFDAYDNVLTVTTLGNVDDPSDDKKVETLYMNLEGPDKWLIGYVKQTDTYGKDSGGGWQLTSSKKITYDDNRHPVQEANWLDVDTSGGSRAAFGGYLVSAKVAYNGDGTIASRTDSMGITTTFDNYGSTHRFPLKKTVHGLQSGSYATTVNSMDLWGHPLSVTDAKGVKTETTYDGLSRPTSESVTFGNVGPFKTKDYYYHDDKMGQPNAQYAETVTHLPGSSLSS
jgi:YD repeat-containing protein